MLDYASGNGWVLFAAALAGAIGGLAAALILLDPSESPNPPPTGGSAWRVVAIRTIVGAVAAAAFLFFFPVEQQITVGANAKPVTVTVYPFLKVIALALVVGSGGSAFLSAMRKQANSFVTAAGAIKATAQVKATSVTALNLLPTIAAQTAKADAAQQAQSIKDVATTELTRTAQDLPSQLSMTGVDPGSTVRAAFVQATGANPNDVAPADPSAGISAIASAVDAIPNSVEATVASTLQASVDDVIRQIGQI